MVKSTDPVATYNEAVTFLKAAFESLDQAEAALKDLDLDGYINTKLWGRFISVREAVAVAEKLYEDAVEAVCPECGARLISNPVCLAEECGAEAGSAEAETEDV